MAEEAVDKSVPSNGSVLSEEQIMEMRHRRLKKHDSAGVLLHWFNAVCWFFLLATGLATVNNPAYAIVPIEWTRLMRSFFGGTGGLIFWHVAVGLLWAGVLIVHIVFGWRSMTIPFLKNNFWMDRDDVMWLVRRFQGIFGKKVELPPQGPYNAGQKLFGITVTIGSVVILLSGLALAFRPYMPSTDWVAWALPIHLFAVGVVCAGLCVHIYMGGVFPEEKQAFFSIFTGEVSELYAFRHHKKWYDEVKKEEAEWEAKLRERYLAANSKDVEMASEENDGPTPPGQNNLPKGPDYILEAKRQEME